MHEHTECEHELKYCSKCNVVYCERCKKEWYSYQVSVSSPWIAQPYITYTSGDDKTNEVQITCTHS